ncbi:hypothetical protein J2X57_001864 [Luteibacter sp. 1214]|uniref:DUF3103 family protein n=1 Tax=Luteibacter sp. 1214 TaxID=2817735 RepID=UPI0028648D02|nr:DUF3103 family protein [Luteibacter sp. 1214]MDR6642652.1 hypothetical protein [Luteibacter sp. 1214]
MTCLAALIAVALSPSLMATDVSSPGDARVALARDLASILHQPALDTAIRDHLGNGKAPLAEILNDYAQTAVADGKQDVVDDMLDLDRQAVHLRGLEGRLGHIASVRVHGLGAHPQPRSLRGFWTAAVTSDGSTGKKQVVAFDPEGKRHSFAIDQTPDIPMLLVETDGTAAVQAGMAVLNEAARGASSSPRLTGFARAGDGETKGELLTILKEIYLEKDHEPNIQGDAEVFAVVSGVDAAGKPVVVTQDMPWLDHDKRWYTPRQDLINWTQFGTNYVNVQFFEDDGNVNFQKLASALTEAVGDTALVVSPAAPPALIVAGISRIGQKILGAMESWWFENSTDYIDSFYVLERGHDYGSKNAPLIGARGEVKMVLAPYEVRQR